MENYSNALNYETVAMNSSGSAMQKYNKYLQGVEAAQEKLTATFEKLVQKAVDSGLIKGFYDLGSALLNILTVATPLVPLLTRLGIAFAIGKIISSVTQKVKGFTDAIRSGTKAIDLFSKSGKHAASAGGLGGLVAAFNPVTASITALVAVIELVSWGIQEYKQSLDEAAQKAQETASKTTGYYNTLISLQEKYDKLTESSSTLEERQSLEEEINNQVKEINENTNLQLNAINLVNGALSEQSEILKGNLNTTREQAKEDIDEALKKQKKKYDTSSYSPEELKLIYGSEKNFLKELGLKKNSKDVVTNIVTKETKVGTVSSEEITAIKSNLERDVKIYEDALKKKEEIREKYRKGEKSGKAVDDPEIQQLNALIEALEEDIPEYRQLLQQKADIDLKSQDIDYLNFDLTDENIRKTFKLGEADTGYIEILREKIKAKQDEAKATEQQVEKYGEIAKLNYADLKNELSELQGAYDALSTAVTDYNEKGYISIDTFESLIDTYNDYLPLLVNENGQLQLNTQTIYDGMAARIQEMAISKALARIKEFENKKDDEAIKLLNDKANALRGATEAGVQDLIMSINRLNVSAETKKAIYNETVGYLNLANATIRGLGKTSSATSSASKTETKYADAIKFAQSAIQKKIDALNDEKEAIEKLNEERQKELDYYDKAISYVNTVVDERISALEKEKDALKEKNDETSKEIELEKLKQNLAKAQKTKVKVFRKGQGFVWETDKSAVDEAQKALDDFYSEEKQNAIQKQIDAWNEYKEALGGISTAYEEEQAKEAFLKKQGFITEEGINNRNLSEIERFKNAYKNKQKQIQETTTDSIDAQIEKWNDLKQSYSDITSNYEYEQERQKAISILGAKAEAEILSGRMEALQIFTRGYVDEMNKQVSAAQNAASGINSAYSSTSFNIPTADQAGFKDGAQNQAPMFPNRFRASDSDITANKLKNSYKVYDVKTIDDLMYFKISDKFDTWIRYYESTIKNKKIASYDPSNKTLLINKKEKKKIYNQYAQGTKSSISGLANVNELGDELFVPPSRGNYQVLQKGTGILNHGLTERLMSMARNPQSYIKSSMAQMGISTSINKGTTQNITIGNVNLPNVSNAQSFVRELKLISQNR